MSVYKRSYRPYSGPITGQGTSFWVLMKYAAADLWSSRITNVLFFLCIVPTLISMSVIYVMNNDVIRLLLSGGSNAAAPKIAIDERFFYGMLQGQCWPALVLTAWIGPKLIAGDLANDALPTILSHPITRLEYVVAKLTVLAAFLSAITWVPMSLLFFFQAYMSPQPWAWAHIHILLGLLVGTMLWIALLSLLSIALASWVKWRIVATGLVFATVFVPAGVGTVVNAVMRTTWGNLINLPYIMVTLWRRLLHVSIPAMFERYELPTTALLIALTCMCVLCAMALNARIRAREVVRG